LSYQRTGNMLIRPLLMNSGTSAFDLARLFYAQYSDLNFESDFIDYLRNGYVVSRPKLFAMARPIEHDGERMWYLRICVGKLWELVTVLPFHLPSLCFCRNNRANEMRIVSTERLMKLALLQAQREQKMKG
jgi:hypothetical protein